MGDAEKDLMFQHGKRRDAASTNTKPDRNQKDTVPPASAGTPSGFPCLSVYLFYDSDYYFFMF